MNNDKPVILDDSDIDVSGAGTVDYGDEGPKIITRHGEVDAAAILSAVRAQVGASSDKSFGTVRDISQDVFDENNL